MRRGTLTPLNSYQEMLSTFCKINLSKGENKDVLEKAIMYQEIFPTWKFQHMVKTLSNKQTEKINKSE